MAGSLKVVTFEFADGLVVKFQRSPQRWLSWIANVRSEPDRKRGRLGEAFSDDFLQPTLIHAQRLIQRTNGVGVAAGH